MSRVAAREPTVAGLLRACRAARLSGGLAEGPLATGVTGVGAPLLIGYVAWVLESARRLAIDRLYFLARDGHVLLQLAEIMAPRMGCEARLEYLEVSRRSVVLPALGADPHPSDPYLTTLFERGSCIDVLAEARIDAGEVATQLAEIGIRERDWSGPLARSSRSRLIDLLVAGSLGELVRDRAATAKGPLLSYLSNAGFLDDATVAIVDGGGLGSQVAALARLREEGAVSPPTSFHAFLDPARRGTPRPLAVDELAWLYDGRQPGTSLRPSGALLLFEMFSAVDRGTVLGYEEDGSPVLDHRDRSALTTWGQRTVQRLIVETAGLLSASAHSSLEPLARQQSLVRSLMATLWDRPTIDEAATFGAFPREAGLGPRATVPIAEPYSMMRIARSGSVAVGATHPWTAASIALTPEPMRTIARALKRLPRNGSG